MIKTDIGRNDQMIIEQSQMELDFVFLLFCGIWANNSITLSSNFFTLIKWGGVFGQIP